VTALFVSCRIGTLVAVLYTQYVVDVHGFSVVQTVIGRGRYEVH
jgi:hypothetical protein